MTIHKCIYQNTVFALAFSLLLFSCRTTQPVQYLQGPIDTAALSRISLPEARIKKGDLIGIAVFSDNPQATTVFNQQMNTTPDAGVSANVTGSGNAGQNMPGYLVDAQGQIRFPLLGTLAVEGLTKTELENLLTGKLAGKYPLSQL